MQEHMLRIKKKEFLYFWTSLESLWNCLLEWKNSQGWNHQTLIEEIPRNYAWDLGEDVIRERILERMESL